MQGTIQGPLRATRFIHRALLRDMKGIDEAAHDDATADFDALADRVDFFCRVEKLHHRAEENGLFPEIEAKRPGMTAMLIADHRGDEPMMEEVSQLCRAAGGGTPEEKRAAVRDLRRLTAAGREMLRRHIHKEEEILIPLAEELFTLEEQRAQVAKMTAMFPPEEMRAIAPWLVSMIRFDDRVAYVSMMKAVMPPERFTIVSGWIEAGIGHDDWQAIQAQLQAQLQAQRGP